MGTFIAHLHPLFVHLPIGFILLAILADWHQKDNTAISREKLSTFMWGMAAISSVLAMATGIAALRTGYYEGLNMFVHLICGYGIAAVCVALWFTKWKAKKYFGFQDLLMKGLLVIGLLVGGHMGGELTHGEEHLAFSTDREDPKDMNLEALDSIDVYGHMIAPIFITKCNRCHEPDDARGRLDMTEMTGLLDDTYGDPAIAPHDLSNSEIYKRMTMSPWENKYMPPSGPPITYKEKKLIEWWIMQGASEGVNLRTSEVDPAMKEFLKSEYGIDLRNKSFYEKVDMPPLEASVISDIKEAAFNVTPLAKTNNFLDVTMHGHASEMTSERVQSLLKAKDHITWLNCSSSTLTDEHMGTLSQLTNLTKLNIQNTQITDRAINELSSLANLSSLNLYGNNITDAAIEDLSKLRSLKTLYLWKTQVTEEGMSQLKGALPNCEIIGGMDIN